MLPPVACGSATRPATGRSWSSRLPSGDANWSWNVNEDGRGVYLKRERKPFAHETKVISRLDSESGTILNRVGPDEYEVMTDEGIEVWREEDIQAADED